MGLGGALLALNRQNELIAMNEQRIEQDRQTIRARLQAARHARITLQHREDIGEDGMLRWITRRYFNFRQDNAAHDEEGDLMEALAASAAEAEGRIPLPPPLRYRWNVWGAEPLVAPQMPQIINGNSLTQTNLN